MRPAADPIPGSAIPARLINSIGFDKAKPPARNVDVSALGDGHFANQRRKKPGHKAGLLIFKNGGKRFTRHRPAGTSRPAFPPPQTSHSPVRSRRPLFPPPA